MAAYGALSGAVSLTDVDARFDGHIERAAAGAVGVVAGDLDNDGLDDLVVGSGADVYVLLAGG